MHTKGRHGMLKCIQKVSTACKRHLHWHAYVLIEGKHADSKKTRKEWGAPVPLEAVDHSR